MLLLSTFLANSHEEDNRYRWRGVATAAAVTSGSVPSTTIADGGGDEEAFVVGGGGGHGILNSGRRYDRAS